MFNWQKPTLRLDNIKLVPGAEDGEGNLAFVLRTRIRKGVLTLSCEEYEYAVFSHNGFPAACSRYADPVVQAAYEAVHGPQPWPFLDKKA